MDYGPDNRVYYRILYWAKVGKMTIATMQYFDEYDYHDNHFLRDDRGEKMRWDNEAEALRYLNDHFKPECIDPDCITPNNPAFHLNANPDQSDIPDNLRE
jgi:hypothetical protein